MVKIIYENKNRKFENNVVYKITIGNYNYIGQTKRPLIMRIREHIYNKQSEVCQYIKANNIEEIHVKILQHLKNDKKLFDKETQSIARYIVKNRKKKGYATLLNKDLKGLSNKTLNQMKNLIKELWKFLNKR